MPHDTSSSTASGTTPGRAPRRILVVCTLVAVVGAIAFLLGAVIYPQWSSWREIKKKQSALLFETDHAALAAACREVWENRSAFGKDEGGSVDIDPSNPKLPRAIRALDPHWIDASPTGLSIELGGQWCHYGFETFVSDKPDDKRTVWKDVYPSKELAPGFWYYAENGVPRAR